jgi:hypothetical protein
MRHAGLLPVRLALAGLLCLSTAVRAELTLTGFVQQNTAVNAAQANPDGRHQKWLEERVRLQIDAATGSWRLLLKGDAAYDHLGRGAQSELREAYMDHAASAWDLRIGRQILTWGLGDLVFVNDVFPKDYEALFAGRPLEYLKRGVDAVKLGAYPDFASFELVVAPEFRPSRVPDARRFHLFDPMPLVPRRTTARPHRGEVALRVYRDLAGWDGALYFYRGYHRTPSARPDNPSAPTKLIYFHPELSTYGASLSGRIGDGVLNLEAAYYDSREDRAGTDFTIPNAQLRLLLGWQTQAWEDFSLNLQYYAERMDDYVAYRVSLPAGLPAERRWNHTLALRATQFVLHQTLRLSVYASRASNRDTYVNPEARYSFTDQLWGAVGANVFGGRPSGQFGQLSRDDNIYFQLRYEF